MKLLANNNPLGREIHHLPIEKLNNTYPGKPTVIVEVKRSIKDAGLLNPLYVRDNGDGTYGVLTGNNRYFAIKKLGYTSVDCYIVEDGDDIKGLDRFFKIKPVDFP